MKVVAYDAGAGRRVGWSDESRGVRRGRRRRAGVLRAEQVVDAGFDVDIGRVHRGGRAGSRRGRGGRRRAPTRAAAQRTLRDFLAFEGHLTNAYRALGRDIPPEWYAARSHTLRAGEVIGSRTAAGGSGLELGRRLSEGDVVELAVEGIGVLRNRIGPKVA
jgi:hypothetical protein